MAVIIGKLQSIHGELVEVSEGTLSLKNEWFAEFVWKTLDKVVALVHIIVDFNANSKLIEFCDVFSEGSSPLL